MRIKCSTIKLLLGFLVCAGFESCTKLVQVPEPENTITSSETFGSDATATSAIAGIYNDILTGHQGSRYFLSYGNGLTTIDAGMSADELNIFNGPSPYQTNTLNSTNSDNQLWTAPYYDIYLANSAVTGLQGSTGVSASARNQLTGEAKFLRAFCYFNLVNLYGAVPIPTTTAYAINDTLSRAPAAQVYQLIISDLKAAQSLLPADYSVSQGQRIRVNQFGATALLARAYLYTDSFANAEAQATLVINNTGLYQLGSDLNTVFLDTSSEAILQLQTSPNEQPYATEEGHTFIPSSNSSSPRYYLTDQLLGSFESGDLRYSAWVDSTNYLGTNYYYTYKYKVYKGTPGNTTENYVLLRLAEQYLIRAEARAEQNNLGGAISDLNVIRQRAGLSSLADSLSQAQVLAAVMQERKIELFCEWGHRWLDLKRTGQATTVLSADKGFTVDNNALLYPIPAIELVNDANLVQNPGY